MKKMFFRLICLIFVLAIISALITSCIITGGSISQTCEIIRVRDSECYECEISGYEMKRIYQKRLVSREDDGTVDWEDYKYSCDSCSNKVWQDYLTHINEE